MSTETVLITGASSDLAVDLIRTVMRDHDPPKIFAHYHNGQERILELQNDFGPLVVPICANLSQSEQVDQLIEHVESQAGFPGKIVHFAGLKLRLERFGQIDLDRFMVDFSVQFTSVMRVLRHFLPKMSRSDGRSKVVFVLSSVTLGVPPRFMASYTVIKYAQLGLMRALAADFAGTSVNINAVSPSMVETRFLSDIPAKLIEIEASENPYERNVSVREVIKAVRFLLSADADALHGVNLPVTGGAIY